MDPPRAARSRPRSRDPHLRPLGRQINPSYTTVDAAYVDTVHDAGMEVHVYTVNNADDMRAQIAKGVDGIISNYPDVIAEHENEQARPAA